jgi:hypothetical protein
LEPAYICTYIYSPKFIYPDEKEKKTTEIRKKIENRIGTNEIEEK